MAQTMEPSNDAPAKLQAFIAQATAKYAVKDYNAAAELYAYATELQAAVNGEMSSANADLLYAYGRCLYHVAVKNSDVLGLSKVTGESHEASKVMSEKSDHKRQRPEEVDHDEKKVAEEIVAQVAQDKGALTTAEDGSDDSVKPYFQFTGDENFDGSGDDQDAEEEVNDEDREEEDDFSTAYEVLDMARVLLQKRLGELEESSTGKGKETEESPEIRQLRERLADAYDLQAEISLEGEKFPAAVVDLRSALKLKKALYPHENSLIAEAHFKLSLALEFSSVTQQKDESGEAVGEANVDEKMRDEAAHELEEAISSCKLRIQVEEARLTSEATVEEGKPKASKEQVDDVKDMVKELSQRVCRIGWLDAKSTANDPQLKEIRQPPVSINDPRGTGTLDGSNPLAGILGSMLGESPAAQKARIEEASKGANDLTGLVKKKRFAAESSHTSSQAKSVHTNGKRKASSDMLEEDATTEKKVRMESVEDE